MQQDRLYLTATFRSHDIYSAWYLNTASLLLLQQEIQQQLPVELGELTVISQSAHIYDDCWQACQEFLNTYKNKYEIKNNFSDSSGNFVVSKDGEQILVEREFEGCLIKQYRGKKPKVIYQQILKDCPYLEPEHCFYLGTELQRNYLL